MVRLAYKDAGLDYYGNGIIATEQTIKDNPDLLKAFVRATLEESARVTGPATHPAYKWHVVAMLWWIAFFNYADRQAIFSVFPLLEREMGLTPVELGLLGSGFAWVYGLGAPFAGRWTLPMCRRYVDDIILLEDHEILSGVRFAVERLKQVLEPAGATALAALLHGRIPLRAGDRVVVVLSGGNVEVSRLGELLASAAPLPGAAESE